MKNKKRHCTNLSILIASLIIAIIGIIILQIQTSLINTIIQKQMNLQPDSALFKKWQKPDTPYTIDIYFFNWTNPEDILNDTIKPKFEEIGPYRFKEYREKVNITWNLNDTVSHGFLKTYFFDAPHSSGTLDDNITSVNIIPMVAVNSVNNWNFILAKGFSLAFGAYNPSYHLKKTARELLFEGYEDPILELSKSFPISSGPTIDRFGWFYGRNGSATFDGYFNVGTGKENSTLGEIYRWNYQNETTFFKKPCSIVDTSAGELFPRNLPKTKLSFYSTMLCRKAVLDFEAEVLYKGIRGYKFNANNSLLDNGDILPENKCYCVQDCVKYGLLDFSSCKFGTPAYISLPHFLKGDPSYLEAVEGLTPNKNRHDFYITVNPDTGAPLEIVARFQVNLLMKPNPQVDLFKNMPRRFFPLLWMEQRVELSEAGLSGMKTISRFPVIFFSIGVICIVLGIFCLIGIILRMRFTKSESTANKPKTSNIRNNESNINNSAKEMQPLAKQKSNIS